jgi:hypothetical protein
LKLRSAAQFRAVPPPCIGYCPWQSLNGRGSLLSALLASTWCRSPMRV